jgi:hypothetical protein
VKHQNLEACGSILNQHRQHFMQGTLGNDHSILCYALNHLSPEHFILFYQMAQSQAPMDVWEGSLIQKADYRHLHEKRLLQHKMFYDQLTPTEQHTWPLSSLMPILSLSHEATTETIASVLQTHPIERARRFMLKNQNGLDLILEWCLRTNEIEQAIETLLELTNKTSACQKIIPCCNPEQLNSLMEKLSDSDKEPIIYGYLVQKEFQRAKACLPIIPFEHCNALEELETLLMSRPPKTIAIYKVLLSLTKDNEWSAEAIFLFETLSIGMGQHKDAQSGLKSFLKTQSIREHITEYLSAIKKTKKQFFE